MSFQPSLEGPVDMEMRVSLPSWWWSIQMKSVLKKAKASMGVTQVIFSNLISPDLEEVGHILPLPLFSVFSVGFLEGK